MRKYVITLVVFLVFCLLNDRTNPIKLFQRYLMLNKLDRQYMYYRHQIDRMREELECLHTKEGLERFAREQYRMHKPNEEIIIVKK